MEIESILASIDEQLEAGRDEIEDHKATLEEINTQLAEAEKKVQSKTADMDKIIAAGKPVEKEIKEIRNQASNVLYTDDGYNYFSSATKAQFELSEKMCEQIEGHSIDEIVGIGNYILQRNADWIGICKNATASLEYEHTVNISDMAKMTRKAFDYGMYGDYTKATETINALVNKEENLRLSGYYKQILAEYMNFTDKSEAQQILKSAKKDNMEVLNPIEGIQFIRESKDLPEQSRNIIDHINTLELDENKLILYMDSIMDDLKFSEGTSKKFENAIKEVFLMLGYNASQPEREIGKGPDDFIVLGSGNYLVIECKNETITDTINKHDCNQLNGSYTWFNNLYQDEQVKCIPIMIHNSKVFGFECSPNSNIRIMIPELLEKFKKNVREFVVSICQKNNFKNVEKINNLIRTYKLNKEVLIDEYTTIFSVRSR